MGKQAFLERCLLARAASELAAIATGCRSPASAATARCWRDVAVAPAKPCESTTVGTALRNLDVWTIAFAGAAGIASGPTRHGAMRAPRAQVEGSSTGVCGAEIRRRDTIEGVGGHETRSTSNPCPDTGTPRYRRDGNEPR